MLFTEDWFTPCIPRWKEHVVPRLSHRAARMLEVGAFEGRSAVWLLRNTNVDILTCVDPFTSYEGHDNYEAAFDANIQEVSAGDRLLKIKGRSQYVLRKLPPENYDGVYIDGSHLTQDVLRDAVLSFDLVKVGGFLLFDDYGYTEDPENVRQAVDMFRYVYRDAVKPVFSDWQFMLERTA